MIANPWSKFAELSLTEQSIVQSPAEKVKQLMPKTRVKSIPVSAAVQNFAALSGLPTPVVQLINDGMHDLSLERKERQQIEKLNAFSCLPT